MEDGLFESQMNRYFIIKYKVRLHSDYCLQNSVCLIKKNQEMPLKKAYHESNVLGVFLSCIDAKAFYGFGVVCNEPLDLLYLNDEQKRNLAS
jgi:hypothetical protein